MVVMSESEQSSSYLDGVGCDIVSFVAVCRHSVSQK